jgi:ubiquinone/menaquinone biosynthesis C-methylase UbiE
VSVNQIGGVDPTYVLGRAEDETSRLERQARFGEQSTRRLFEDAGITTGMKVLDLGSGAGDVAFLAADLVGPTGRVVGVDLNPAIVERARERARAASLTQVSFLVGDVREVDLDHDFDAVVGRYVLMYMADAVAGLRAALRAVRDGGRAAFIESYHGLGVASFPVSPLHQFLGRCVVEVFARGGIDMAVGPKLHQTFLAAGLETPQLRSEAPIGGGREWVERFTAAYGATALRSLMPQILRYGIASEDEVGVETFDQRYQDEVLTQGSVVQWFTSVAAWARKSAPA